MKYVLIVLTIVVLAVLCGGVMAIAGWRLFQPATDLAIPPTLDPDLVPTPTIAAVPSVIPTITPSNPSPNNENTGPAMFTGNFAGTLFGSAGSSAPITLEMTQTGNDVTGIMSIGPGLVVEGGNCGSQEVPPGTQSANGRVDPSNPNHLDASAVFQVQGLTISIMLVADMSADGQTMTTQALIDLPFICGPDPVLNGTFTRQ